MQRSVRLLLFSQLSLWGFLLACFLLLPRFLLEADEGGISNYGVYAKTIVPYTLAFGLSGLLTVQAAQVLPEEARERRTLQCILYVIGALNLLVLESTYLYQVNGWLDTVHVYAGIALYMIETGAALWLWRALGHDMLGTVLLGVQLAGAVVLGLTLFGYLHVLFVAEALSSIGFGALLIRAAARATA